MNTLNHWTLAYEEKLSTDVFAIPSNRMFVARLTRAAELPAGPAPVEPEAIALQLEVRQADEDEFKVAACTPWLDGQDQSAEVSIPAAPELPFGERGPVCRLRLLHRGRLTPSCTVAVNA